MRVLTSLLLPLPALLFAIGCAETRTFQIGVRNETTQPITCGLTKVGGKYEHQWRSPEQAVVRTTGEDERGWDSVVVPPGELRSAGPVKGNFSGGAVAILRVYGGDLNLSDALAVSRGSPGRVDVPLEEGRNAIIIRDAGGKLTYERVPVSQGTSRR
jgi:hypothetical protein